jgi:hypothetical protein
MSGLDASNLRIISFVTILERLLISILNRLDLLFALSLLLFKFRLLLLLQISNKLSIFLFLRLEGLLMGFLQVVIFFAV